MASCNDGKRWVGIITAAVLKLPPEPVARATRFMSLRCLTDAMPDGCDA